MKKILNKLSIGIALMISFDAAADINIAVVAPMRGDYKYFSEELIEGAKIAVDEINNRGGLHGEKINLIPIDDPCDDALSLSASQMMALNKSNDDKMHLVLGPHCSNSADEIADTLEKAQIIQILPTSVSQARYIKPHNNLVFFTGHSEEQANELMRFVTSHYPTQTLAVIYDERDDEMASVAATIAQSYANSKTPNTFISVPYRENIDIVLDGVGEKDIDLAYIMGNYQQVASIAEKLKDNDDGIILFANRYQLHKKFARKVEALSQNSFLLSLPPLTNNNHFASSLVRLRLWGIEPEGLMPYGYLSIKMWADAIKQAKSFNYKRIMRQLNNRLIDTGWDNVTYTNGVPDKSLPYTIYRIHNGKYTQVY